jgi:hypothetical protein
MNHALLATACITGGEMASSTHVQYTGLQKRELHEIINTTPFRTTPFVQTYVHSLCQPVCVCVCMCVPKTNI